MKLTPQACVTGGQFAAREHINLTAEPPWTALAISDFKSPSPNPFLSRLYRSFSRVRRSIFASPETTPPATQATCTPTVPTAKEHVDKSNSLFLVFLQFLQQLVCALLSLVLVWPVELLLIWPVLPLSVEHTRPPALWPPATKKNDKTFRWLSSQGLHTKAIRGDPVVAPKNDVSLPRLSCRLRKRNWEIHNRVCDERQMWDSRWCFLAKMST